MAIWKPCLVAVSIMGVVVSAHAQQASKGTRTAYDYALRCFVVAGKADPRGARASFDAAVRLGGILGFSNKRVNEDFAEAISTENIKILRDPAYRSRLVSECRQLGMAT